MDNEKVKYWKKCNRFWKEAELMGNEFTFIRKYTERVMDNDETIADRLEDCWYYSNEDLLTTPKLKKTIREHYRKMKKHIRDMEKVSIDIIDDMED